MSYSAEHLLLGGAMLIAEEMRQCKTKINLKFKIMIVKSMNSREIMNEIAKDYPMVVRKAIYLTESLRREAVKSKKKHVCKIFDYKSQRQNNWFIIIDYYVNDPTFNVVLHYVDDFGFNGIMVCADRQTLMHYTPHFLERYNERFLKNPLISKKELLKRYITENAVGQMHIEWDEETMTDRIFVRSREGIALGLREKLSGLNNLFLHYKTYISNTMIFKSQEEIFNAVGSEYEEYWNDNYSKRHRGAYELAS